MKHPIAWLASLLALSGCTPARPPSIQVDQDHVLPVPSARATIHEAEVEKMPRLLPLMAAPAPTAPLAKIAALEPVKAKPEQAYVDPATGEKIVRVGIQNTDCGCCRALTDTLNAQGLVAQLEPLPASNALQLNEYPDRCRVVEIDGVTFAGYGTEDLARIVKMKLRGDLPKKLASDKRYQGVDPRKAKPLYNQRTLLVKTPIAH